jgi:hypothetical protein
LKSVDLPTLGLPARQTAMLAPAMCRVGAEAQQDDTGQSRT